MLGYSPLPAFAIAWAELFLEPWTSTSKSFTEGIATARPNRAGFAGPSGARYVEPHRLISLGWRLVTGFRWRTLLNDLELLDCALQDAAAP